MSGLFVTGTDTGVGKTRVSSLLIEQIKKNGQRVVGMKPVASGCEYTKEGWRNADALALMRAANVNVPYERINRYAFARPVAPHIAAEQQGVTIDMEKIAEDYRILQVMSDSVIIEGVGGWIVPLNSRDTIQDLAVKLHLPVVLVVSIRLGCMNHALLTAQAIRCSGLRIEGWVANQTQKNIQDAAAQIEALKQRIPEPLLQSVAYQEGWQAR